MDFRATQEEEAVTQEVREFLKKELPHGWVSQDFPGGYGALPWDFGWDEWYEEFERKVAARGWPTITWPREYGGRDGSIMEQFAFYEEMARYGITFMNTGIRIIGPSLLAFGTEEQKKRWLPDIGRAVKRICLGYSEPGSGSDLASLETKAVKQGDRYIISRQKTWVTLAHLVDYCWLLARTNPKVAKHRGLSVFMVDLKSPGITIKPIINMMDIHSFNEVFFDEVEVPAENLIGGENNGWAVITYALSYERLTHLARFAGTQRIVDQLVKYVKEKGIAENTVVRNSLAQMVIEAEVGRLLTRKAMWVLSQGMVPEFELTIAKVFYEEMMQRLSNISMQILGLFGQGSEEDDKWAGLINIVRMGYLATVSGTMGGGTSEVQRNIIATRCLGLPR